MKPIRLSQIEGFRTGHAQDPEHATGCTAIICENGAWAGVDVRGGSPASRETELLRPENTVQQIHCVMLSGGSAYGLEAGDGAMEFLEEKGIGFDVGIGRVPIVCGASLFDLELVSSRVRPDKKMGYEACQNAWNRKEPAEGNAGAGTGATVGKFYNTERMMKCGIGIWAGQIGDVKCGAVVAVNALGDVVDYETGRILAGLLNEDHTGFADTRQCMYQELQKTRDLWSGNTTIGCVITNAKLDKNQCRKAAVIAHDGYAQTIRPSHCTVDGDTLFVMASGQVEVAPDAFYAMASEAVARAVNRAALCAAPAYGLKAASDFLP
ncbi:MAG TPA: P1 family peptidase [Candidatus Lachnoclostridium stercorigallinarum]|uniref:P1 family peptidase n=1 Tax=Candidatus Lachnoclostridium stercorigallinarum TaxID=2838634 RepID=A0A9D2K635_9FIRM|nr:P1 family peptidase [Candidatus Lachnoclostridium stercorigallinarum]